MTTNVVAAGMVTALGLDWRTSCAAARAGLSRAGPLQHFRVQGVDSSDAGFAVGHQADLLTLGFEGRVRLVRLLAGALKDLAGEMAEWSSEPIPVYLSLPHPGRTFGNVELFEDEESREEGRQLKRQAPAPQDPADAEELLSEATRRTKFPGRLRLAFVSRAGRAGTMEALERAALDDTAIVGAVDSLLDDDTLAWLRRTMRLKTKGLAAGIVPGEAAVLFLLSRRAAYGALGTVEAVAFDAEERPLESAQSPLGRGLARVVGRLAQQAAWPGQERAWIVSDHNGEPYAAADWGWAQHRLAGSVLPDDAETWFPAVSFGDTGGAGAAAAMMCAIAAWKRGYAPAARCAIMACQDDGRRAGLMLSAPGGERHGRS